MFVHGFPREAADQVGLRAVGEGERVGHLVEGLGTHWTLTAELFWLVALSREEGGSGSKVVTVYKIAL